MFSVAKAKRQLQMFSVAKAKRQLQMFSVAKAKRQLQMFSARKRSDSGNYAKAKLIFILIQNNLYSSHQYYQCYQ